MLKSLITRTFPRRRAVRPPAAVQIAPGGVLAGRRKTGTEPVFAFRPLPPGALIPGIHNSNVRSPELVTAAVKAALEAVSPDQFAVTTIVPDLATRVFLLEFDAFPDIVEQAEAVLRLRLRKIAPCDTEKAKISFQTLSPSESKQRVMAVMIPACNLEEYEGAVQAAGFQTGAVLPASLAALEAGACPGSMILVALDENSLTTLIANSGDIVLYRAHPLSDDLAQRQAEVKHDVSVAATYFEDKLMARPQCLHFAGIGTADEFSRMGDTDGLPVIDVVPQPGSAGAEPLQSANVASILGALAAAR